MIAVPIPPVAHKLPTPHPKLRRNQPLIDPIIGTIVIDAANDIRNR